MVVNSIPTLYLNISNKKITYILFCKHNIKVLHIKYLKSDLSCLIKLHTGLKIDDKFKMTAIIDQNHLTKHL